MSDIIGEGYGSDHDWRHSHTSMGRQTLYVCLDCDHHFWHDYPRTPDIFQAMREANVPEKCADKESESHTSPVLTPEQLDWIRKAAARYRRDEAGLQMLEALRKAEAALDYLIKAYEPKDMMGRHCDAAFESVRAAIAAAE